VAQELVEMSSKELDRLAVVRQVVEGQLTQAKAGEFIGLSERQVRRLCAAFEKRGPASLVSGKRGQPSNRRLPDELRSQAIEIVRDRYADFGPTLACEKLLELHDLRVSKETLRAWLIGAGIWIPRRERVRTAHQPRHRRECLGELVQIDGCEHAWFEERGPVCSLLVYVDDVTGRLMELRFVEVESAFDYFASTSAYLQRHGKPVAFYSDKHSIFRVYHDGTTGRARGITQFGRALTELNIDIICANSPQAKGRVERMNKTLQDRLVKELRLRGISTMEAGNAFLPEFMEDYNRRFGRTPKNSHDAHRPLRSGEDLSRIFTWQEERTMSRNLVVHFKRVSYLVEPGPETLPFAGKRVRVFQWEDGRVEIRCEGQLLPYSPFDKNRCVNQGAVVENKRLGAVLSVIQASQLERDNARLASKRLTLREKERIEATLLMEGASKPSAEPTGADGLSEVTSFLKRFEAEQKARTKAHNERTPLPRKALVQDTKQRRSS
jgi:transposase